MPWWAWLTVFDYAASKADADELIAEFGMTASLQRAATAGPKYNPTIGSPTPYSVTVVVIEFRQSEVDGTRVLQGDKKVFIAKGSLSIDPLPGDKLVISGATYVIVRVEPLAPAGTVVMWTVQVRKS